MKTTAFLMYCVLISSCATAPKPAAKRHYVGRCVHPVLGDSIPVDTRDGSSFDGTTWRGKLPDGSESVITGAACLLHSVPDEKPE